MRYTLYTHYLFVTGGHWLLCHEFIVNMLLGWFKFDLSVLFLQRWFWLMIISQRLSLQ